ncbi:hypothetical protein FEDK69T_30270 [Flavobacterium enshiense DK69]|uniref:SMODS and SLOG-associating 2TM effector domain-containing protein n=1 Tax=Flavobacterium enshiense DK69 TaxID=1107311 RepID=V6S1U0_9FLAO|nr:hypothetical protein [Flavobacterium enshiense]ESU20212.1 hypothetical protein FEDK69T_30270 [Flavobacterium enshiense DK69]KGO91826.1 hypothetical protein Q767_15880 [Flavobacterium enshiense DK69]
MSETRFEIQKEFRERQEKYVYYLIALSVSAIGFSIFKTDNQTLNIYQIPLAIAVICWSVSIFCGLKFLKYVISSLYNNNSYFEIINGKDPKVGNNLEKIEISIEAFKEAWKINANSMKRYFTWQGYLFYTGIILFIVWHIIEMYFRTQLMNLSCH